MTMSLSRSISLSHTHMTPGEGISDKHRLTKTEQRQRQILRVQVGRDNVDGRQFAHKGVLAEGGGGEGRERERERCSEVITQ